MVLKKMFNCVVDYGRVYTRNRHTQHYILGRKHHSAMFKAYACACITMKCEQTDDIGVALKKNFQYVGDIVAGGEVPHLITERRQSLNM